MNDGTCRSCGAAVVWAVTVGGKRVPLDPIPVAHGNLFVTSDGMVEYLKRGTKEALPRDVPRFVSHFSSCPDAKSWRKAS